jgi:hypothetical protein
MNVRIFLDHELTAEELTVIHKVDVLTITFDACVTQCTDNDITDIICIL